MYEMIVMGTSAGGLACLKELLPQINRPLNVPILIVQHLQPTNRSFLADIIETTTGLKTYEVEDKMLIEDGCVYTPAPNYHILMEKDWTLTLSVENKVSYARPSIDVTFESVADACRESVIGVLLTGANHDGAKGLKYIQELGGYTIVQEPSSAYANEMPNAALGIMEPDAVLTIEAIAKKINDLVEVKEEISDEGTG